MFSNILVLDASKTHFHEVRPDVCGPHFGTRRVECSVILDRKVSWSAQRGSEATACEGGC
jgi:hypothetical protein